MINIIIAYDDNDYELGDYFETSHNDIHLYFSALENFQIRSIRGLECSEEKIINEINSFDEEKFGFVGLSHGSNSQLVTENEVYVHSENVLHFNKSLFYSTACSTANELGHKLIESGCFSFVGFTEASYATYEDFYDIYVKCENYCLKDFFNSNKTIKESFLSMLSYFDNQILSLLEQNDEEILVAMELIKNRDCIVLLGNEEITKNDLL